MGKNLKSKRPKRLKYKELYLHWRQKADEAMNQSDYFEGVAETGFTALSTYGRETYKKILSDKDFERLKSVKIQPHKWIALAYHLMTQARYERGQEKFDLPSILTINGMVVTSK